MEYRIAMFSKFFPKKSPALSWTLLLKNYQTLPLSDKVVEHPKGKDSL
jgi:hypothetical protein